MTTAYRPLLGAALSAAAVLGLALPTQADTAAKEVNLYSYRQPFLMKPLLDAFTEKTGIDVNVVYAKKGILERLKAEGRNSPADAVLTADVGRLQDMAAEGLLAEVDSDVLARNIPAQYRNDKGLWFGLTTRARIIFAHKERVKPGEVTTYEDLAKPHMKGRVCTRSGKHPYSITLLASIVAEKGEKAAEAWAAGVKENLARKPQGNDRAQVKAVYQGECDVSLGNTYYMGKMATNEKQPEQKQWAAAVDIIFPNQDGRGTHVNASGGAVTKAAAESPARKAAAVKLLEFLSGDYAQKIYAEQNFEYPVKAGVPLNPMVQSWGAFKADTVNLAKVAAHRETASKIMDRVGFDH
jgi:iron(III) transport system substrate-binding protein